MEVCGGQTHAIVKFGIDELLPKQVTLIHGPGCPVCVTPVELIDKALDIAARPEVIFCSFGDMLRVPGSTTDLLAVKAGGGDVRIVYSPLDAVKLAAQNPGKEVVFFAVGFETTAPATAMAVYQAAQKGLKNFSLLVSHVLVPPAIEAILRSPDCRVQGFLAAGHVCTVMGFEEYVPIAAKYRVPIVVTGFEPLDILQGVLMCVQQLEAGRAEVENQYTRAVRQEGNLPAPAAYPPGLPGRPPQMAGHRAKSPRAAWACARPTRPSTPSANSAWPTCASRNPPSASAGWCCRANSSRRECPAFGTRCTPEHPLGATMVSSEGACAAYYRYRREPAARCREPTRPT